MAVPGDNVTISPSSIGASNAEGMRYILDSSEQLQEAYYRMHGYMKALEKAPNGSVVVVWKPDKTISYNPACCNWMDAKLSQILNKNQFLSRYNTAEEMNKEGFVMVLAFQKELFFKLKQFEISKVDDYIFLKNFYSDFVSQAIRHALYQSDKDFLGKTTSETTMRSQQDIREQTAKGGITGILGGLLGGGK